MSEEKKKIITLRGSESDITKWDVSPFEIGHAFWLPKGKFLNKPKANFDKTLEVEVPLRLNPIILDLSRFTPTGVEVGEHGAGEVTFGISTSLKVELKLVPNTKGIKVNGIDRKGIVEHTIKVFQKAVGFEFGVKITITSDEKLSHLGLGTTPTLMSATILGLNELLNKPFDDRTLCKLVSYNYGEEFSLDKSLLVPGITTGGAFWNCIHGGLNVVSGEFEHVFHSKLPEDLQIVVGIPNIKEKQHAEKGFEIPIMDLVRKYDRFDAGKISYWVLMRLIPATIDQDINKIGEVLWDVTLNTAKAIPPIIKHGTFDVFDLLAELYVNEIEGAFISSAGPSLACLTLSDQKLELIKKLFQKYHIKTVEVSIDDEGLKITN